MSTMLRAQPEEMNGLHTVEPKLCTAPQLPLLPRSWAAFAGAETPAIVMARATVIAPSSSLRRRAGRGALVTSVAVLMTVPFVCGSLGGNPFWIDLGGAR